MWQGNQAFIVDTDGKAYEIIGSSSVAPSSNVDTAHFLQMDDLASLDPLIIDSLCDADIEEYVHLVEYAWLSTQDTLHASMDWHKRRRNVDELDLVAITAAPLSASSR